MQAVLATQACNFQPRTLTPNRPQGVTNRDLKLENLLLDRDGRDGTRPLLKTCNL